MIKEFIPKIPYGMRDFLPREAKSKRLIEGTLAGIFAEWGYDEVITPTIEYFDTLALGCGTESAKHMYKFFDTKNSTLALRPDMTTPMARVAATRLRESAPPFRLFYLTNVFRYEEAQAGRHCEFYQAGVELLGSKAASADAEVIALAVEAMREAGLESFQISLGQVEFINGLMAECQLTQQQAQQVKTALVTRDLVGLGEIVTACGLSAEQGKALQQIPMLHGRDSILTQAYKLVNNAVSKQALDNLSEIFSLLESYGVAQFVNFDLGIIRDFEYYTGMVFEGYTPGLGFPVCGGGRYDNLVSSFGVDCPATGFALGIERVMLALERQGIKGTCEERDIYVGWRSGSQSEAIQKANSLRRLGKTVELALTAQSKAEAADSQQEHSCKELVYIGE